MKVFCPENREFFAYQERKLKRINGFDALDNGTAKTMVAYVVRIRNVNKRLANKPLREISPVDIQRVYDDLEDRRIVNGRGARSKMTWEQLSVVSQHANGSRV